MAAFALVCKGAVVKAFFIFCIWLKDSMFTSVDALSTNSKLFFVVVSQLSSHISISIFSI